MKFVNRTTELQDLEEYFRLSRERLFPIIIYGQRRVGKTELIKRFYQGKKYLYFFVYEGKTKKALLTEFTEELKRAGIIEKEVHLKTFDEFIAILFKKCSGYIIVFDEAQFMRKIYPSFFSVLQRHCDENKETPIMFIFLGSIIGLMKKLFEDTKAPLYGRIKAKINLKPLSYADVRQMLTQLGYSSEEQFVEFFAVFGGVPKYYVAIEDFGLQKKHPYEIIENFLLKSNAPLADEVVSVLRQEFGSAKGYYYSILEAIATGHTKLSEISSYVGISQTSLTPFLSDLTEYYEMLSRKTPVTEKKGKRGIYAVNNNFFRFWFRFIHRYRSEYEISNYPFISAVIRREWHQFVGSGFEQVVKETLEHLNRRMKLPFLFNKIGSWWGAYKDESGERKTAEIDIVGLNEQSREILFCECKWAEDVDAEKVLAELKRKAGLVEWNKGKRKEYYAIFAKSFRKRIGEVLLFDLKDMEEIFRAGSEKR